MQPQLTNNPQAKNKDEEVNKNQGASSSSWNDKDRSADKSRVAEEAGGVLSTIKQGVSQFASKAEDMASDVYDKTQEYGEKMVHETGSAIKRNPTEALLIGCGVGLLVGFLIARR